MNDEARDPFGTLATAAVALHELFVSLVKAGFTEEHALRLVTAVMVRQQPPAP
jgi:hypothetical protein